MTVNTNRIIDAVLYTSPLMPLATVTVCLPYDHRMIPVRNSGRIQNEFRMDTTMIYRNEREETDFG